MANHIEPDNIAYDRHNGAVCAHDPSVGRAHGAPISDDVDFVAQVNALSRARRILEIGTGPGAHARELARRGHKVIATDVSTPLIEYARAQSRLTGQPVAYLAQDFRDLEFPPYFDLILNFNAETPLALENDDLVQAAVVKIRDLLRRGGQFLFGRSDFRGSVEASEEEVQTPAGLERCRVRFDPATRTVIRTITLEPEGPERSPVTWAHRSRLYTLPEVEAFLGRAGLAIRGLWHAYDPAATWVGPERPGRIILAERIR